MVRPIGSAAGPWCLKGLLTAALVVWLAPASPGATPPKAPAGPAPHVDVIHLEGVIAPATARYVIRAIREA